TYWRFCQYRQPRRRHPFSLARSSSGHRRHRAGGRMRFDYREALAGKSLLLLDFDGPVCSVFAGYPALQIAAELVETIDGFAPDLAAGLNGERDPMEVLRSAARSPPAELVDRVDEQLNRAELEAVESAEPTL